MPIEISSTIALKPTKRNALKSCIYFLGVLLTLYSLTDKEKMAEIFVTFLTWVDDLFVDSEALM